MFSSVLKYATIGLGAILLVVVVIWRIQVASLHSKVSALESKVSEQHLEIEGQKVTLATRAGKISGLEDQLRVCEAGRESAEGLTKECLDAVKTTGKKLDALRTRLSTAKIVSPEEVGHVISLHDSADIMRQLDVE